MTQEPKKTHGKGAPERRKGGGRGLHIPPPAQEATEPAGVDTKLKTLAKQVLDRAVLNVAAKANQNKSLTAGEMAMMAAVSRGEDPTGAAAVPARATSIVAMAQVLGVSAKTFYRWREKYTDFPKPNPDWSWNTAAVQTYCHAKGLLDGLDEDLSTRDQLTLELLRAQVEQTQLALAVKNKNFAPVEILMQFLQDILLEVRSLADSMPRAMALKCNPKNPAYAEKALKIWRDETFFPSLHRLLTKSKEMKRELP